MANVVRNPYSNTAGNTPSSLGNGVLAVNQADGRLFFRSAAGVVTTFSSVASFATTGSFPAVGLANVLYVASDSSRAYQFVGGVYVEVGGSGGGIATTSASDLTSGTLADARLSANVVLTGDSRLTDSRTPTSHTHGNITNAGAIGSTSGQIVVTTTSGVLTTAATIASSAVSGLATVATSGSAADLSGTLADARLSSAIATHATLAAAANQTSSALDIFPRGEANAASASPASGTVWMTYFTPAVTITVSSITMVSGNATAASGLTLARMGLYTFDESTATLVARTASDTTLFSSLVTAYQRSLATAGSFPASYTLTAGTRYGVAVVIVGSTIGNVVGRTVGVGASALGPRMSGTLASQSDLPATATISASQQTQPFARLS